MIADVEEDESVEEMDPVALGLAAENVVGDGRPTNVTRMTTSTILQNRKFMKNGKEHKIEINGHIWLLRGVKAVEWKKKQTNWKKEWYRSSKNFNLVFPGGKKELFDISIGHSSCPISVAMAYHMVRPS